MGSRRAHMPVSVQRDAALIALGLDPAHVEWHHTPPLSFRERLPDGKYLPDENDARHIVPLTPEAHAKSTFGTSKATTAGSDIHNAAKIKRIRDAQAALDMNTRVGGEPVPAPKGKRAWPKRPFPKQKERKWPHI